MSMGFNTWQTLTKKTRSSQIRHKGRVLQLAVCDLHPFSRMSECGVATYVSVLRRLSLRFMRIAEIGYRAAARCVLVALV